MDIQFAITTKYAFYGTRIVNVFLKKIKLIIKGTDTDLGTKYGGRNKWILIQCPQFIFQSKFTHVAFCMLNMLFSENSYLIRMMIII
jgi:hypothetical protein